MNDVLQVLQERYLLQKEFLGDEKPINKVQPLVSVSVPTYQHSRYISECLDGILMQQTSFPIEIIIGEDGSTDGTREICEEYAIKHQDKIRLFNRDRKLSQYVDKEGHVTRFNGIWNRMSARGKYIAMCEGDDYWTDPLKLQKQVDVLESSEYIGLVYSKVQYFYQSKNKFKEEFGQEYNDYSSLLRKNCIPTLTAVLRTDLYKKYIEEIQPSTKGWKMGDYPMWLWFAQNSKLYFLNEIQGVYRVLDNSASHSTNYLTKLRFTINSAKITYYFASKYHIDEIERLTQLLWVEFEYAVRTKDKKDISRIVKEVNLLSQKQNNLKLGLMRMFAHCPKILVAGLCFFRRIKFNLSI